MIIGYKFGEYEVKNKKHNFSFAVSIPTIYRKRSSINKPHGENIK
jgi:hypothetical protein